MLGLGVERRRWLVKNQQQRIITHEAAGQRQLLPLTEADLLAPWPGRPELCLEPDGQPSHDVIGTSTVYRGDNGRLVVEAGHVTQANRVPRPKFEAEKILECSRQTRAPTLNGNLCEVSSINKYSPL